MFHAFVRFGCDCVAWEIARCCMHYPIDLTRKSWNKVTLCFHLRLSVCGAWGLSSASLVAMRGTSRLLNQATQVIGCGSSSGLIAARNANQKSAAFSNTLAETAPRVLSLQRDFLRSMPWIKSAYGVYLSVAVRTCAWQAAHPPPAAPMLLRCYSDMMRCCTTRGRIDSPDPCAGTPPWQQPCGAYVVLTQCSCFCRRRCAP